MEHGLKQRIIGALVLVVAAVIFLPMLLSGQDETVEVQVEVPEQPVMQEDQIATAQPPALPQPAPVAQIPEPAVDASPEPPADIALIESPPPVVNPAPVAATEPVPPPAVAAPADGWVVQQGGFASQDNAERLRQLLLDQGYNAYTRAGQAGGNSIVRVYVGPLSTKEAAARIRDELERRHKSKGLVVAYDEATRAP